MNETKRKHIEENGVVYFGDGSRKMSKMAYDNAKKYKRKYDEDNYLQFGMRFHKQKEKDLYDWIKSKDNATRYIIELIRTDYIDHLVEEARAKHIADGFTGEELEQKAAEDRKVIESSHPAYEPSRQWHRLKPLTQEMKEQNDREKKAMNDLKNIMKYIDNLSLEEKEKILSGCLTIDDEDENK